MHAKNVREMVGREFPIKEPIKVLHEGRVIRLSNDGTQVRVSGAGRAGKHLLAGLVITRMPENEDQNMVGELVYQPLRG